jgi:hypothetical protein
MSELKPSDIVDRLRRPNRVSDWAAMLEAANLIETLRAEVAAWNRRFLSRSAILEEAAKVADEHARLHPLFNHGTQPSRAEQAVMDAAAQIAAAIRSLITHKEKGDE